VRSKRDGAALTQPARGAFAALQLLRPRYTSLVCKVCREPGKEAADSLPTIIVGFESELIWRPTSPHSGLDGALKAVTMALRNVRKNGPRVGVQHLRKPLVCAEMRGYVNATSKSTVLSTALHLSI
jgi:hypothetical protein